MATTRFYTTSENAHLLTKTSKKTGFYFRTLTRTDEGSRVYCEASAPMMEYIDVLNKADNGNEIVLEIDNHPSLIVRQQIGQRIQELRKDAGLTQAQLAEKCGMAQPNIARIEAGTYATSLDVLSRIAEALGKRIELV